MGEYKFDPDWVVAPGETLAECLDSISLLPRDQLAQRAGIDPNVLALVITGDHPINEDLAERFFRMTGVPKRMWLALEHNYRAGLAAGKKRAAL